MTQIDELGRPQAPLAGGEVETLLGFLDFQRATLEWKCAGLDADQLARSIPPSTMTLGGMLKHLAFVESDWFSGDLLGQEMVAPWNAVDWDAERDWDWHSAADDDAETIWAIWRNAVAESRAITERALADGGLDQLAVRVWSNGG